MARDDYPVIVYQILCYLYNKLKKGEPPEVDCLRHNGSLYNIPEPYWVYVLVNLIHDGYVIGPEVTQSENIEGEKVVCIRGLEHIQITPKGIEYLTENSFISKARSFVKETVSLVPFELLRQ